MVVTYIRYPIASKFCPAETSLSTENSIKREIFLQEPTICPKLVLLALRSLCEGASKACPELAVALNKPKPSLPSVALAKGGAQPKGKSKVWPNGLKG